MRTDGRVSQKGRASQKTGSRPLNKGRVSQKTGYHKINKVRVSRRRKGLTEGKAFSILFPNFPIFLICLKGFFTPFGSHPLNFSVVRCLRSMILDDSGLND